MNLRLHLLLGLSALALSAPLAAQPSLGAVSVHPAPQRAVHRAASLECAPPNSVLECAKFHAEIRHKFSPREIGMLFGPSSAYAEYRTSYAKVVARYDRFARNYDESNLTAFAAR